MDERIRDLMDAVRAEAAVKRVSVKALAAAADVSYVAMRRYLASERPMSLSQMYRVADALGVSLGRLVADASRRASERATDRPTDRPTDHSQRNRRHRQSEGQLALSARTGEPLRETITQSAGTDTGPLSQAEFDAQADADIRAALHANRVKSRRRSG